MRVKNGEGGALRSQRVLMVKVAEANFYTGTWGGGGGRVCVCVCVGVSMYAGYRMK